MYVAVIGLLTLLVASFVFSPNGLYCDYFNDIELPLTLPAPPQDDASHAQIQMSDYEIKLADLSAQQTMALWKTIMVYVDAYDAADDTRISKSFDAN